MGRPDRALRWIDSQRRAMRDQVETWANINSGSLHRTGLEAMAEALTDAMAPLDAEAHRHELPPWETIDSHGEVTAKPLGTALSFRKRPDASRRVLLSCHMDTVFGPQDPFQQTERLSSHRLRGPGVADAKGGLVVLRTALEAVERSGVADGLGWEVLINPDEEIGSPGSRRLLEDAASRHHLGLVFEPTLASGRLASERRGSGNFTLVVRGRSAHAGRSFDAGRNAITAMAGFITALDALNTRAEDLIVNIGEVEGGGPVNMVPDLAVCRFNLRYTTRSQEAIVRGELDQLIRTLHAKDGIEAYLHGGFTAPPKPLDEPTRLLCDHIRCCGDALDIDIAWEPTAGVCDGNRLAAAGLPNVDTMGVRGDGLHSAEECMEVDSLPERAKLTALLLIDLARGEVDWLSPASEADSGATDDGGGPSDEAR